MDFVTLFFVVLSVIVLGYFLFVFKSSVRIPLLVEVFFIAVYGIVLLLVLFPSLLGFIEETLGIGSAVNFIVYLSVFVLFFIVFVLYRKSEEQRLEITKLVREIAYLKKK